MNKYTKRNGIMLRYFKCTAALLLVTVYFLVNCKEKGNPLNNNSGGSTAVINIISGNNQTGNGGEIWIGGDRSLVEVRRRSAKVLDLRVVCII